MSVIVDLQRPSIVSRTPVFCFHDITGTVDRYNGLAKVLGNDRPIFGVVSPGIVGDNIPENIDDLAKLYANEIQAKQPDGPYLFVGWSFGGLIAEKVADELRARDAVVNIWAIDSVAPNVTQSLDNKQYATQLFKIAHIVAELIGCKDKFIGVFGKKFEPGMFSNLAKIEQIKSIFNILQSLVLNDAISSALIETTKTNFMYALDCPIKTESNSTDRFKLFSTSSTGKSFCVDESFGWDKYFLRPISKAEIIENTDHFSILTDQRAIDIISSKMKADEHFLSADLEYEIKSFQNFMMGRGLSAADAMKTISSVLLRSLPTPAPTSPTPPPNSSIASLLGISGSPVYSAPPSPTKYKPQDPFSISNNR